MSYCRKSAKIDKKKKMGAKMSHSSSLCFVCVSKTKIVFQSG